MDQGISGGCPQGVESIVGMQHGSPSCSFQDVGHQRPNNAPRSSRPLAGVRHFSAPRSTEDVLKRVFLGG